MKQAQLLLLTAICISHTCLGLGARAALHQTPKSSTEPPMVVAHWIVPMTYSENETDVARAQNDVKAAVEEGLDGFALDAFNGAQAQFLLSSYISAATTVGATHFKVFLSADLGLGFKTEEIVETLDKFADNPGYLHLKGKPLLSTFGGDQLTSTGWQSKVTNVLREHGHEVTFVPYFDRPHPNWDEPNYANWLSVIRSFPVADGLFNFLLPGSTPFYSNDPNIGHHWWSTLEGEENLATALRDNNKLFIAPYMPYYWASCHSVRQYIDYEGGRGMANSWQSIIAKQNPQVVEIVTWNDYSESTYIQPTQLPLTKVKGITSYPHLGYFELLKYYIKWFHTGNKPTISSDAMFYCYRPNLRRTGTPATDSLCPMGAVKDGQIWGKGKDVIYLTTALTSPAEIRVTSGAGSFSYAADEGIETIEIPASVGTQGFELWRNGKRRIVGGGPEVTQSHDSDNFNLYSGYSTATGETDSNWQIHEVASAAASAWFR